MHTSGHTEQMAGAWERREAEAERLNGWEKVDRGMSRHRRGMSAGMGNSLGYFKGKFWGNSRLERTIETEAAEVKIS